ncbi:MAG TPA: GNAT family N-acetyltransferase [Pseudonocardiaceae bacterium]|nr:GNAT family N-acetyltransferase [Pseudonocardiaceae bacterium]
MADLLGQVAAGGQPRPGKALALPVEIVRAELPSPELGRFLYTAVGRDLFWVDRLLWPWRKWYDWLAQPGVESWVAWVRGTPAGYAELHAQPAGQVELTYFGLLPSFTGQGLGGHLLTFALDRAWTIDQQWPGQPPTNLVWLQPARWTAHTPCRPTSPKGYAYTASRPKSSTCPPNLPAPGPGRADSGLAQDCRGPVGVRGVHFRDCECVVVCSTL